jgi:hypothetical protein
MSKASKEGYQPRLSSGGAAMQQNSAWLHADSLINNAHFSKIGRTRWRSDQSIGLPSFIFTEGWFDVRDHEARGQSVLELCEWPSP